ncbi:MAG TPA: SRPBCC family protein, partial [Acidobacteriota bacterium]|nr:SRPBCC family protein [Acidobacteriota bacterium]
ILHSQFFILFPFPLNIMDTFEERIIIRALPDQIMPYLIEPELIELWSPTEVKVTLLSRRKTGPGTKFQFEFLEHGLDPITYVVVTQTPTLLVCSFEGRMVGEDRWELTKQRGNSTELYNRMEFRAPDTLTWIGWKAAGRAIAFQTAREKMPLIKEVIEEACAKS